MPLDPQRTLVGERVLDPKRALDLILATLLLALAAPLLAIAATVLAARGDGAPGPRRRGGGPGRVLAREEMAGLNGRPFTARSLRTRWLRLDLLSRLPQVVLGRMSLVGPAPLPVGSAGAAPTWRQGVRPGITGLAQVRRHARLPWYEPALLDQHYVEHHWLGTDLLILLLTPGALGTPRPDRSRQVRESPPRTALRRVPRARRRTRTADTAAVPVLRARPGSRTARARVAASDADHRSRRYIAAR